MNTENLIIKNLDHPKRLEQHFREDPMGFKRSFDEAWERNPESQVLAAWYERLNYIKQPESKMKTNTKNDFFVMGLLALLAGMSTRGIFYLVEKSVILPVDFILGIVPFMGIYLLYHNKASRKINSIFGISILLIASYINILPDVQQDSTMMVYLHLPVLLWILLGFAFTGDEHASSAARLAYLKFNGEFGILYIMMAIGGMILTALTIQLFNMIDLDITEFYFKNVVIIGIASLSVVAAYLISLDLKLSKTMAPYIAKLFSPLVLLTLMVYLCVVFYLGKNPFVDRDFLIAFNGILLIVLGVTIFSITERDFDSPKGIWDMINFALISLVFVVDTIALTAMVFRLTSFGITPNRIAVLGVNGLIWGNLIWIMMAYYQFLRDKVGAEQIQHAVTKYLPLYGIWAAFVIFSFPILFR